jgi:hypothetical protein
MCVRQLDLFFDEPERLVAETLKVLETTNPGRND